MDERLLHLDPVNEEKERVRELPTREFVVRFYTDVAVEAASEDEAIDRAWEDLFAAEPDLQDLHAEVIDG
jgi:hypothetical protein